MNHDELLEILRINKDSALNWRYRRHEDWFENYTLYRDKVMVNRLTQRQSVNVPMMKTNIRTLLKDVDDPPALYFDNLDNDEQKEVYYNEYWKAQARWNKLILKDIIDKKQVMLYGRSFKKLNIKDGKFFFEIVDPQDMLVDRYVDPSDIETARFLIHEHIYKPLSSLDQVEEYDKSIVKKLKEWYATEHGLLKADENIEDMIDRNERMEQMGVPDINNPILGETYVELNEHYVYLQCDDPTLDCDECIYRVTVADDQFILDKTPLCDIIGHTKDNFWYTHYPYTTWGDDIERTDFWSDSIADILRVPNKILNAWASQLVENRTLRNYGMHYYNSSDERFAPQTFTPIPWGWYPVPGNPDEIIKKVDIPDLSESLDEMTFLIGISEKATAATSAQQGATESRQVTLGEVEIALANAKERVKSMSVFYMEDWREFGLKYTKMLEAASDLLDEVEITKKGRNGQRNYTRTIKPEDWMSEHGYNCDVKMMEDKQQEDIESIQKLNAARNIMQNNAALEEIYKKKVLEFAGLSVEETQRVLEAEKALQIQPGMDMLGMPGSQPTMAQPPGQPQLPAGGDGLAMPVAG